MTQATVKKEWKEVFLDRLRKSPNVAAAAKAAGYSRGHVYRVRENDEEFSAAWDEAIGESLDAAEGELYRRAVRGTIKKVYYQDKHIDTVREYSDTLLIFLLKSHKPNVYRETVRNEHSGPDGKPVEFKDANDASERILSRIDVLASRIRTLGGAERTSTDSEGQDVT